MGVLSRNQLAYHTHRIRPGMPPIMDDHDMLGNESNLLILNDNASDENSS
jgi:hypothetical protein